MDNVKMSLFIQEHTHTKQYNSNPIGDVYRTVLYIMKGGYNKAVLRLGTGYIAVCWEKID